MDPLKETLILFKVVENNFLPAQNIVLPAKQMSFPFIQDVITNGNAFNQKRQDIVTVNLADQWGVSDRKSIGISISRLHINYNYTDGKRKFSF